MNADKVERVPVFDKCDTGSGLNCKSKFCQDIHWDAKVEETFVRTKHDRAKIIKNTAKEEEAKALPVYLTNNIPDITYQRKER